MSAHRELFKLLHNGYPFIYCTKSLGMKFIGLPVFRDCSDAEKKLYDDYLKEFNRVHKLSYTPDNSDVEALVFMLNRIIECGDTDYSEERERKSAEDLWNAIEWMEQDEISELEKQHDALIKSFDFRDGAFYRHYNNQLEV